MSLGQVRAGILAAVAIFSAVSFSAGQRPAVSENKYKSQEIDEHTGVPVLMEHLPNYDAVAPKAVFATDLATLKRALGDRPQLDLIDFTGGTEAVTAHYDAGKLLIIEYSSPQQSVEADAQFQQAAAADPTLEYRRTGNYNALVFDVTDKAAADSLLDQVHYQKQIQWLGENPFDQIGKERAFIIQTESLFVSTLLVIAAGIGMAIVGGLIIGSLFFLRTEKRRRRMAAFSDAGGMTRLNLDGFTPEILPDRLLRD